MEVLHVIPSVSPVHGGPSRAIAEMERALCARGINVTTVTTNDDGNVNMLQVPCGIPIKTDGATRWYFARNSSFYKVSLPLAYWLKRNIGKFDLVHAHALFSFAPVAAAFLARRAGVPYVLRPLGVLNGYGMTEHHPRLKRLSLTLIERRLIEAASAVHFTSRAEQAEAEKLNLKCKGIVIPLGIDCAAALRQSGSRNKFCPDQVRLLFLSRVDPKKNLEGLLRALSHLSSGHPQLSLDVVGDGEANYVGGLKALATTLGITDRVRWHGYLADGPKQNIMMRATALVLPSRSENFGIVVAEALAAGLPCIVSRQVGVAEMIERCGAGIVVEIDPASIAAGLETLLSSTSRYRDMQAAALSLADSAFSLSAMGERLENMYHDICQRTRQSKAVAC
jgi:glycosyltransferase involved in cell wall biosynthesis